MFLAGRVQLARSIAAFSQLPGTADCSSSDWEASHREYLHITACNLIFGEEML